MSDYTREEWLRLRSLAPKPPIYLFVSKALYWDNSNQVRVAAGGQTYRNHMRKIKIGLYAVKQATKAKRRALKKTSLRCGNPTPTVS